VNRRLPRTTTVGRHKIRTLLVSQTVLREIGEVEDEAVRLDGLWVPTYEAPVFGTIYVEQRLPLAKKWDVYFHELIHAVNDLHAWVAQEVTL
jgi:hypothetical protein